MNQKRTIVVLEDDRSLCLAIEECLSDCHIVSIFDLPSPNDERLSRAQLILIDETLPSGSGYDFAVEVKKSYPRLPIIFITANATKALAIKCLNLGINRFLEKPFSLAALREQVLAAAATLTHIELGSGFRLNLAAKELLHEERPVPLTPIEYRLVEMLALQSGRCLSRDEIHRAIWADRQLSDNTIDTHFSNLKKKQPALAERIANMRSRGYLWRIG